MRMGRMLGSTAVATAAGITLSAADWPQWRGPRRDGIATETGLLKTGRPRVRRSVARGRRGQRVFLVRHRRQSPLHDGREGEPGVPARVRHGDRETDLGGAYRLAAVAGSRRRAARHTDVDGTRVYAIGGEAISRASISRPARKSGASPSRRVFRVDSQLGLQRVAPRGRRPRHRQCGRLPMPPSWHSTRRTAKSSGRAAAIGPPIRRPCCTRRTASARRFFSRRRTRSASTSRTDAFSGPTTRPTTALRTSRHPFFAAIASSSRRTTAPAADCSNSRQPAAGGAKELYFTREMRTHHNTAVLIGDHMYGFSGAILTAMKFDDGTVAWRDRSVGKGSLVSAEGQLYLYSENGVVGLADAAPEDTASVAVSAQDRQPADVDAPGRLGWAAVPQGSGYDLRVYDVKAK